MYHNVCGSAATLPWKAQGFGRFRPKTLRRNKANQPCKPRLARLAALFPTHYRISAGIAGILSFSPHFSPSGVSPSSSTRPESAKKPAFSGGLSVSSFLPRPAPDTGCAAGVSRSPRGRRSPPTGGWRWHAPRPPAPAGGGALRPVHPRSRGSGRSMYLQKIPDG